MPATFAVTLCAPHLSCTIGSPLIVLILYSSIISADSKLMADEAGFGYILPFSGLGTSPVAPGLHFC